MTEPEMLQPDEIAELLKGATGRDVCAVMTHLKSGKWYVINVTLTAIAQNTLHLNLAQKKEQPLNIQIDQPVGIAFDESYNRYILETVVVGFEPSVNESCQGRIIVEIPDRVEKMQRRAYSRVKVPADLNVKVLFWHRGYDDSAEVPLENYWQGRLIDLSAGGMQIGVNLEHASNFKAGQYIGLQFTPLPYHKPLLIEGQIMHLQEASDHNELLLGIHALGLEATNQGRQNLRRIVDVVEEYEKANNPSKKNPNIMTA